MKNAFKVKFVALIYDMISRMDCQINSWLEMA